MATRKGGVAVENEESDEDPIRLESPPTSESIEEIDVKDVEKEEDDISIEMISPFDSEDSSPKLPSQTTETESPRSRSIEESKQNEKASSTAASSPVQSKTSSDIEETRLAGWLKLSGQGFRKVVKQVWFVYDDEAGKLYYYRQPQDLIPLGEIDVRNASFTYDTNNNRDRPGLFEINSNGKTHSLEAEDPVHMVYWLDALQRKRKAFSLQRSDVTKNLEHILSGRKTQVASSGLLGENRSGQSSQYGFEGKQMDSVDSNTNETSNTSETSRSLLTLRKEIRKTMSTFRLQFGSKTNQPTEEWTMVEDSPSPPESPVPPLPTATTQWHVPSNFTEEEVKPNRSHSTEMDSETNLAPAGNDQEKSKSFAKSCDNLVAAVDESETHTNQSKNPTSPKTNQTAPLSPLSPTSANNGKSKFMSALRSNFSRSTKDKTGRSSNKGGKPTTVTTEKRASNSFGNDSALQAVPNPCSRCRVLGDDLFSVNEDLRAAEEELEANREIVRLLQKEVDVLRKQINTRNECEGMEEEQMMQILHQKDKHVVELEHSRAAILEEKSMLAQKIRLDTNELKDLREQISMFQQTLGVKDEIIIHLTNQNQELKNNNRLETVSETNQTPFPMDPNALSVDAKELELLQKKCQEYEKHNLFQRKEIQELLELRKHDQARERMLIINLAEHEAKYCQIQSKYLYLLNEKKPVRGGENTTQEAVNQLLQEALESETAKDQDNVDSKIINLSQSLGKEYDNYGFLKYNIDDMDDNDILISRANMLHSQSLEMEYMLRDADEVTSKRIKWENFMVGQPPNKTLVRSNDLKTLIRLGVPYEFRERVWMSCINMYIGQARHTLGVNYYKELEERAHSNRFNPATKQIELDLLRTLPDNRFFEKVDSDGVQKLRRVLLCYSVHNPVIGYCQGLNRIAAIALLFLREEEAFWCLVTVIDYLMPADYYTTTLAAAQADQRVLKDLVQDRMPRLLSHMENNEVDLSLFTFNWFLTVFVDNVKPDIFLHVWDCFMYEGSKVLFRFALAFLKYAEEEILKQPNTLMINRYMRNLGKSVRDVKRVLTIAFSELNPFPMKSISSKRVHHLSIIKEELKELDAIRKDFKSSRNEEEAARTEKSGYLSDGDLDDA